MTPGERLKKWRVDEGLMQSECAQRVGCGQSTWSGFESGKFPTSLQVAAEIEKMTGGAVPMQAWVGLTDDVAKPESDEDHDTPEAPSSEVGSKRPSEGAA